MRPTGRNTSGVHGMRLRRNDEVISMDIARDDSDLFLITDNGYGKRTPISEWRVQGRGGQGVIAHQAHRSSRATWSACGWCATTTRSCCRAATASIIRMRADGISRQSRTATGVRVMNMREGDVVSAVARMVVSESGATDEEIDAE